MTPDISASLHIALLGPFQATHHHIALEFETETTRALLAYLILHAGAPIPREVLADVLWPDQLRTESLHALRQTLNRLKHGLEATGILDTLLIVTRQTIQFNLTPEVTLDVTAFESLIAETRAHPHRRLTACAGCMQRLESAAALYRGDLFTGFALNSLPFEEWALMQREVLRRQAMEVFYTLANFHLSQGDYLQAQTYARRQIVLEPWREEAQRQLIRALALSGQRSAALAQYEQCRKILLEELAVEPEIETRTLYQQVRAGEVRPTPTPPLELPARFTPFVGRSAELTRLSDLLNRADCRLLTLVGPGGVGKTRLALQIAEAMAHAFRDGVQFIPLAPASAPEFLIPTLAQALHFDFYPNHNPQSQLHQYLRKKEILLVLDNFEHLLRGVEVLSDLLRAAPDLTLLVTSRERLNVSSEWVFEIGGFSEAEQEEAAQLFITSAQRVCPHFAPTPEDHAAISRICQLTEGLPLAIELAAAWRTLFACQEIVHEIERDLDFLNTTQHDVPERHRSLRAVFASSWALLTPEEQSVCQALSVFGDSFEYHAARAVADASPATLAALINKSFLRQESTRATAPRYLMHDLLQHYAAERLAADSDAHSAAQQRYAAYYLTFLEQQTAALKRGAQREALAAIGGEIQNIRVTWERLLARGSVATLAPFLPTLFFFYDQRSWFHEGAVMFAQIAVAAAETDAAARLRLHARACQGWFTARVGQRDAGQTLLQESLAAARALQAAREIVFALNRLGAIALFQGAYAEARHYCTESLQLCRQEEIRDEEATAVNILGQVAYYMGDYAQAQTHIEQSLTLARIAGLRQIEADALRQLGNVAYYLYRYEAATDYYTQALESYRQVNNRWGESAALSNLGALAGKQGQYELARTYLEQSLAIKRAIGDRWGETNTMSNLGVLASDQGDYSRAGADYQQALVISRELGARRNEGQTLNNLGVLALWTGAYAGARTYLEQAVQLRREIGDRQGEARSLANLSQLAYVMEEYAAARELAQQALHLAEAVDDSAIQAEAWLDLGNALSDSPANAGAAAAAYRRAITLWESVDKRGQTLDPLAGLARLALLENDLATALDHVNTLLQGIETHRLVGCQAIGEIYLTCVQVLQAAHDPRAATILATAQEQLQQRAATLHSASQRRSYLESIATHRRLMGMRGKG